MFKNLDLSARAAAAGLHLLICFGVALVAAALVFGLWYPGAYRLIAGGRELFLLVITVDIILGPLLTFAVFERRKGWLHLRRDLAVIGLIQIAALGYGLYTVVVARPVALVFEVDRFRVLNSAQIVTHELPKALPEFRSLPLTGPWLLGTRKPESAAEKNEALFTAINGADVGQRPMFWQPYSASARDAIAKSRPIAALLSQYPSRVAEVHALLADAKVTTESARFLPVMARGDWVAILDQTGAVVGFLPVDGFF